jgi:hypothetical protein
MAVQSQTVLGDDFAVIEPIDVFLAHLSAIERSPGTVRSYAFDLRDYFTFLDAHRIDWVTVRLEHLGRFVAWLRLPPDARSGAVTALPTAPPHCSATTINRKLSAVASRNTATSTAIACSSICGAAGTALHGGTGMSPTSPSDFANAAASWRQRLELAHTRIKELTHDNTQLRKQLAHAHGQLRAKRATPSKTLSTRQNA